MSVRAAFLTYAALLVLVGSTVESTFVPMGPGNSLVNLAIAAAKAALIGAVFMHLRSAPALVALCLIVLLVWLGLMYGLTLNDYLTR